MAEGKDIEEKALKLESDILNITHSKM